MYDIGRILIADDEETFLLTTAEFLRNQGFESDCALDGQSARNLLNKSDYDLLIADIKMPGNSDLEIIRDDSFLSKKIPVILITGYPSMDSAIKSIHLPVFAYMIKPIEFDELLNHVHNAMKSLISLRTMETMWKNKNIVLEDADLCLNLQKASYYQSNSMNIQQYLEVVIFRIINALSDLKKYTSAVTGSDIQNFECSLSMCPINVKLIKALRETVDIIELTKTSFRSKQLACLREKIEDLLKSIK